MHLNVLSYIIIFLSLADQTVLFMKIEEDSEIPHTVIVLFEKEFNQIVFPASASSTHQMYLK